MGCAVCGGATGQMIRCEVCKGEKQLKCERCCEKTSDVSALHTPHTPRTPHTLQRTQPFNRMIEFADVMCEGESGLSELRALRFCGVQSLRRDWNRAIPF